MIERSSYIHESTTITTNRDSFFPRLCCRSIKNDVALVSLPMVSEGAFTSQHSMPISNMRHLIHDTTHHFLEYFLVYVVFVFLPAVLLGRAHFLLPRRMTAAHGERPCAESCTHPKLKPPLFNNLRGRLYPHIRYSPRRPPSACSEPLTQALRPGAVLDDQPTVEWLRRPEVVLREDKWIKKERGGCAGCSQPCADESCKADGDGHTSDVCICWYACAHTNVDMRAEMQVEMCLHMRVDMSVVMQVQM